MSTCPCSCQCACSCPCSCPCCEITICCPASSLHPRARALHLCPRRFRCLAEGGDTILLAPMFLCLPTGLVCDGVLLVSVTPCPLIYSVYTLLCTVTGGRADRRRAPRVSAPPRAERVTYRAHSTVSQREYRTETECGEGRRIHRDPHPETVLLHALASSHTTKTHSHLLLHVEVCPLHAHL